VADCDSKVTAKTEKIISTADGLAKASQLGRFVFGETVDALANFLKQMGLTQKDVKFDRTVEMGGVSRIFIVSPRGNCISNQKACRTRCERGWVSVTGLDLPTMNRNREARSSGGDGTVDG
jgi:hypothetical protein